MFFLAVFEALDERMQDATQLWVLISSLLMLFFTIIYFQLRSASFSPISNLAYPPSRCSCRINRLKAWTSGYKCGVCTSSSSVHSPFSTKCRRQKILFKENFMTAAKNATSDYLPRSSFVSVCHFPVSCSARISLRSCSFFAASSSKQTIKARISCLLRVDGLLVVKLVLYNPGSHVWKDIFTREMPRILE